MAEVGVVCYGTSLLRAVAQVKSVLLTHGEVDQFKLLDIEACEFYGVSKAVLAFVLHIYTKQQRLWAKLPVASGL